MVIHIWRVERFDDNQSGRFLLVLFCFVLLSAVLNRVTDREGERERERKREREREATDDRT